MAEVDALGGHLIEPVAPDRAYDAEPPAEGHCYYTPLTVWAGICTIGHTVALSRVADPSELRATRTGTGLGASSEETRVTLRWRWSDEASACLVIARQGTSPHRPRRPRSRRDDRSSSRLRPPGLLDAELPSNRPFSNNGRRATSRTTGSSAGVPSQINHDVGPWHIRVYSLIDLDGCRSISPGLEPSAATILPGPNPEVTVSYLLKRPWVPVLPWSVVFRTTPPGSTVPPMVLVAHHRAVPLSVDDGEIVARFPACRDRLAVSDPHAA